MCLDLKRLCLLVVKSLLWILIIILIVKIGFINYSIGLTYCKISNIPKNLLLTIHSMGFIYDIVIAMYIFEFVIIFLCVKYFNKIKLFNKFLKFISLEI